jgi:hypothetical protein
MLVFACVASLLLATVHGFGAEDGSHALAGRQVETPVGRRLFAGPAQEDNRLKQ